MAKILFLDIDGVVNKKGTPVVDGWQIDPELAFRIGQIVLATDCLVVLSSSWRHFKGGREVVSQKVYDIFDVTPSIANVERGEEIEKWICDYLANTENSIQSYAILDDDNDFMPSQYLFRTDCDTGITEQTKDAVIRHLTGQPCLGCGNLMVPVKDDIAKKFTGYLWRCSKCMPTGVTLSVG